MVPNPPVQRADCAEASTHDTPSNPVEVRTVENSGKSKYSSGLKVSTGKAISTYAMPFVGCSCCIRGTEFIEPISEGIGSVNKGKSLRAK